MVFFNYERLKLQSNFYLPFILQRQVAFSKMKCTHTYTDRQAEVGRKMVRKMEREGAIESACAKGSINLQRRKLHFIWKLQNRRNTQFHTLPKTQNEKENGNENENDEWKCGK